MAYVYSGKNQYDIEDLMRPREMQASTTGPKAKPHPLEKFGKLLNLYGNLAKAALPPADGEGRLPVDRDRLLRSIMEGAGAIVPMMTQAGMSAATRPRPTAFSPGVGYGGLPQPRQIQPTQEQPWAGSLGQFQPPAGFQWPQQFEPSFFAQGAGPAVQSPPLRSGAKPPMTEMPLNLLGAMTPEEQLIARNRALMMARNPQLARAIPGAGPQAPPPQLQIGMGEDPGMLAEIGSLARNLDPMMGGGYRNLDPNRPRLPGGSAAMGASFERQMAERTAEENAAKAMMAGYQGAAPAIGAKEPTVLPGTGDRAARAQTIADYTTRMQQAAQAAARGDWDTYAAVHPGPMGGSSPKRSAKDIQTERYAATKARRETTGIRFEAGKRGMTPEALKAERRMLARVGTGAAMEDDALLAMMGERAIPLLAAREEAKGRMMENMPDPRARALTIYQALGPYVPGEPPQVTALRQQQVQVMGGATGETPTGELPKPSFEVVEKAAQTGDAQASLESDGYTPEQAREAIADYNRRRKTKRRKLVKTRLPSALINMLSPLPPVTAGITSIWDYLNPEDVE